MLNRSALHCYTQGLHSRYAGDGSWSVPDLLTAYGFARGSLTQMTRPIGIIEFGGAYFPPDMSQYCAHIGMPEPIVSHVGDPFRSDPMGADIEVALDAQIIAAATWFLRSESLPIRIYWATDFESAIQQALKDNCSVLSCSWGADEADMGKDEAHKIQQAAFAAIRNEMIIVAASGDNSTSDGGQNAANVDSPASCPQIIAVGGTTKPHDGPESAWGTTNTNGYGGGCGYSTIFPFIPGRQVKAPPPPPGLGRMVPDVAALADPATGYQMVVHRHPIVIGGTSGAAPLWAAILGCLPAKRFGMYARLWENAPCTDVTDGVDGTYTCNPGVDVPTGLGVPDGAKLTELFSR